VERTWYGARQDKMIQQLFTTLTNAVESTPGIAFGAAFVWGVLSILLSPCHLSSIPLVVGFIDKQGRMSAKRAFIISTLFAVGILTTIAGIGAITAAAGRMMGDIGRYGNYIVAVILFVVGLHLLDVIPMPWSGPGQVGIKRKGMLAAFIRSGTLYICLYGSNAGRYFQTGSCKSVLRSLVTADLRSGTLFSHCSGWYLNRIGSEIYELEREIKGHHYNKRCLWRIGHPFRPLPDLHCQLRPSHHLAYSLLTFRTPVYSIC